MFWKNVSDAHWVVILRNGLMHFFFNILNLLTKVMMSLSDWIKLDLGGEKGLRQDNFLNK